MIVDADGVVRDANPAACAILGIPELVGNVLDWEDGPLGRALGGEEVSEQVISFTRPDGETVWLEAEAGPVSDPAGDNSEGAVVTFNDVTDRIERERRYAHEAHHDHLTGLANRRMLELTLDSTVARAQLNGRGVAVLLVDLDGFKDINDQHGHDVGDVVLRELAARLRCNLRERDLVARYGGDEFVVVLADLQRPEEVAEAFAERLRDALAEPVDVEERSLVVRASVGMAVSPDDGRLAAQLLTAADRSMYTEKSSARN